MNTVLSVCAVSFTAAIIVAVVFFIRTMIQVRRTASEAELLLKNINYEANKVKSFTDNVTGFVENVINSPWLRFGTMASSMASSFFSGLKKGKKQAPEN